MPIQYQPVPEFQVPNLNLMGAYAQGAALQQQQLQEERLRQQMDLAERAAGVTANKESREASKAQMEERVKLQELKAKVLEHAKAQLQNIPEGDDAAYQAIIGQYKEMLPDEYAIAQKMKWNADTRKRFLLTPEQQYAQAKPEYMEASGEVYKKTPQGLVPAPIISGEGMPNTRQDLTTDLIKDREQFRATPYFDVNAQRVGYGSDTVTREDGTIEKVRKGMAPITEQDAERDLQRRIQTEFVPKAAAKIGEENWSRLPENTRAALTSVAYNYGNIPSRIVPAVQSGNLEAIAKAIESLSGDNKGVNAGRRMQEANIARGTGMPGSRAVPAFAAAGAPTFMGGSQIQPPINMMGAAPINAMAAPQQPLPSVAQAAPFAAPQPLTVGTKKRVEGQSNIDVTLEKLANGYKKLDELGAMVSSSHGTPYQNIRAYAKATPIGQVVEGALGTKAQKVRGELQSLVRSLITDIKNASGMSAQELNSNVELQTMLKAVTDPTQDIDTVMNEIANLSERYGTGKHKNLRVEEPTGSVTTAPANRPPLSSFYTGGQ